MFSFYVWFFGFVAVGDVVGENEKGPKPVPRPEERMSRYLLKTYHCVEYQRPLVTSTSFFIFLFNFIPHQLPW